jgi:hypothetical protein
MPGTYPDCIAAKQPAGWLGADFSGCPVRLGLLNQVTDDLGVVTGAAGRQTRFDDAALLLSEQLSAGLVYRLLAEHGGRLFGDDYFADLFTRSRLGRPTVPACSIATVMLLQAQEGL